MEDKRLLKINPDLFSLSNNTSRKKPRKPTDGGGIKVKDLNREQKKEETLRNKAALLRLLRRKQEEKYRAMIESNNNPTKSMVSAPVLTDNYNSDFQEAKTFMDNLVKKQENTKNYTVKQYPDNRIPLQYTDIHSSQQSHPPQQSQQSQQLQQLQPIEYISDYMRREPSSMQLKPSQQLHPNFRNPNSLNTTFKNNYSYYPNHSSPVIETSHFQAQPQVQQSPTQSQQYPNIQTNIPIVTANANQIMEQKINESLKRLTETNQLNAKIEEFKEKIKPKTILKQKKTRRRTYKIGKSKVMAKISVLVSNKTIRKDISTKTQLLKQVPIQDIRKYLMKRGFIKVGSVAPNDVLRKMYESAILICGEVQNHNPDNLLYNFLNNEKE